MRSEIWYSPEEIRWQPREQVKWLIRNLPGFQAGVWPGRAPMLKSTAEFISADAAGGSGSMPYVPDVIAFKMARQIMDRLNRCGIDGEIVKARLADNLSVEEVALRFAITRESIYWRTSLALKYMQGKLKDIDYRTWRRSGKRKQKSEILDTD